jgi:4'-phosphopantetheinyl transferase
MNLECPKLKMYQFGHEVHVWAIRLRGSNDLVEHCLTMLTKEELERAERFRFQHLRRTFILSHGCVRILLAQYAAVSWTDLRFGYKRHGKPYVSSPPTDLCFNQSDSGDLAVFAFAIGCELGVDVEAIRSLAEIEDLARRFFSPEELVDFLSLPSALRRAAFFAAWTRKEAYLKAVGAGLNLRLDAFRVTLLPDEEARLLHIGGNSQAADSWHIHAYSPADGYVGALAYKGRRRNVRLFPVMEASALFGDNIARTPAASSWNHTIE